MRLLQKQIGDHNFAESLVIAEQIKEILAFIYIQGQTLLAYEQEFLNLFFNIQTIILKRGKSDASPLSLLVTRTHIALLP